MKTIPVDLAEKLKEKGMLIANVVDSITGKKSCRYTYAHIFDWLMEKGWLVVIGRECDFANEQVTERFEWVIEKVGCFSSQPDNGGGWCDTWYEAVGAAIEKALTLI